MQGRKNQISFGEKTAVTGKRELEKRFNMETLKSATDASEMGEKTLEIHGPKAESRAHIVKARGNWEFVAIVGGEWEMRWDEGKKEKAVKMQRKVITGGLTQECLQGEKIHSKEELPSRKVGRQLGRTEFEGGKMGVQG